jgi:hypothetical protein
MQPRRNNYSLLGLCFTLTLKTEAAQFSKTSVNFYTSPRQYSSYPSNKLPPLVISERKVKSYVEFLSMFMTTEQAGWSGSTILSLYFGHVQFESWPRH